MSRKSFVILVFILCLGLIVSGCPKKTVVKEEPSIKKGEESVVEKEKAARLEAERKEREVKAREEAAKKEFEKSLVAKKTPGMEGEVYESKLLKGIHFDFDKYNIRPDDAEILKQNAAVLKRFPAVKIQVEGHCDERGTNEYNLALGERRASSAKKYLITLGIDERRISTISYGEEKPLDPGHIEEAWTKNRRAEFIVLTK